MAALIEEHCTVIDSLKNDVPIDHLERFFNDFSDQLNILESSDLATYTRMRRRICTVLCNLNFAEISITKAFVEHSLFGILRDYLVDLLQRRRNNEELDEEEESDFTSLPSLIYDMVANIDTEDGALSADVLVNQALVDELVAWLQEISTVDLYKYDELNIKTITLILDTLGCFDNPDWLDSSDTSLFDAVIECTSSASAVNIFSKFKENYSCDDLTVVQSFIVCAIPKYIFNSNNTLSVTQLEHLLEHFIQLMDSYGKLSNEWSETAIGVLSTLSNIFLWRDIFGEESDNFISQQFRLINSILRVLSVDSPNENIVQNCTMYLFTTTLKTDLLADLKQKNATSTLLKLTTMEDGETQFNLYRILAALMTENDIKQLANPREIATVFIDQLTSVVDDSDAAERLKNLLNSLKLLLQHDQIRDEILNQNGLPLLLRCAIENTFDPIDVKERSIQILLIMSFNNDAAILLNHNAFFKSHLKSLLKASDTEPDVKRAAEGLLWKLEKEVAFIATQAPTPTRRSSITVSTAFKSVPRKKFDIMISYSHHDKDLCYKIHERLEKDGYKVWLDRDQMHGSTTEAMANAIENSEFVILCMSDTYKQSAYCKVEAHYAFDRQCYIIPLVMKLQYKPDGWLGIIVSGKIYVDFCKNGFDVAYTKLKNEILQQKTKANSEASTSKRKEEFQQHEVPMKTLVETKTMNTSKLTAAMTPSSTFPRWLEQWKSDDVERFFIEKRLDTVQPVCINMNGPRLLSLYRLCSANHDSMYRSLNAELSAQQKYLAVNDYYRFLDELKPYVPMNQPTNATSASCCCVM